MPADLVADGAGVEPTVTNCSAANRRDWSWLLGGAGELVRLSFMRHAPQNSTKLAKLSSEQFQEWLIRKLSELDHAQTEKWVKSMESLKRRHEEKERVRLRCLEMNDQTSHQLPSLPKRRPSRLSWAEPLYATYYFETEYPTPSHSPSRFRSKRLVEQKGELSVTNPCKRSSCAQPPGERNDEEPPSKMCRTSSCCHARSGAC